MTLKDNLLKIKDELIEKDPDIIYNQGVDIKLGRSEDNYQKAIQKNCEYILSRSNHKVIMALDRYNKRKEKNKDDEKSKFGFIEII